MVDGIAAEIEVVETPLQVVHVVVAAVVCEDGLAAHLYMETADFACRRIHPEGFLGCHYKELPLIRDESVGDRLSALVFNRSVVRFGPKV